MSDISLASDFHALAMAADAASYKHLHVDILFHMPDQPGLLQRFSLQMHDKLDLAVEQIIIIRAALENPNLATHLLGYVSAHRAEELLPGQIEHITKKVQASHAGQDDEDAAMPEEIEKLKDRTTQALLDRISFSRDTNLSFKAVFEGATDQENIANIEMAPETRYLMRLRSLLETWCLELDGPLHSVNVYARDIGMSHELEEAVSAVADSSAKSGRIQVVERRMVKPAGGIVGGPTSGGHHIN